MEFKVDLDLVDEMAECIFDCSWVSAEEIAAYMKSCITNRDYDPRDWSVNGRGETPLNRDIEHENNT